MQKQSLCMRNMLACACDKKNYPNNNKKHTQLKSTFETRLCGHTDIAYVKW